MTITNTATQQIRIIRSSLVGNNLKEVMTGGLLVMFAIQVLGFSSGEISLITSLLPLWLLLRYPCLKYVERFPRFKTIRAARLVQLALLILFLVVPPAVFSPTLLFIFASCFVISNEFLINAIWLNMVSEMTEPDVRGRFFGHLRTQIQIVGILFNLVVFFVVGERMNAHEHWILLAICFAMIANSLFWLRGMNDTKREEKPAEQTHSFFKTVKTSGLLRRPLLIDFVKTIWEWPIIFVYLLNSLHVPANIASLFLVARIVGQVTSLKFWGRLNDAKGFRFVLRLSFLASCGVYPLLFFVPDFAEIPTFGGQGIAGIIALLFFGLIMGILAAGQNLAATVYHTAYLRQNAEFFGLNILTMARALFLAALTGIGGATLIWFDSLGLNQQMLSTDSVIWIDGFKLATLAMFTSLVLTGAYLAKKIPSKI